MGYDSLLAAAVTSELAPLLMGRALTAVLPATDLGLVFIFGPRRTPAFAVLATEPLPALYGGVGLPPDALNLFLRTGTPPAPGIDAFVRLLEVRLVGRPVSRLRPQPWERVVEIDFAPREGLRGDGDPAFIIHEAAPKPGRVVLLGPERTVTAVWPSRGRDRDGAGRLEHGAVYRPPPRPWTAAPSELAADLSLFARSWSEALAQLRVSRAAATGRQEPAGRVSPVLKDLILRIAPALGPVGAAAVVHSLEPASSVAVVADPFDPRLDQPELTAAAYRGLGEVVSHYPSGPFEPCLIVLDTPARTVLDVAALATPQAPGRLIIHVASANSASATWHLGRRGRELLETTIARTTRKVHTALERVRRKARRRAEDLTQADDVEQRKRYGELLLTNLHRLKPGDRRAEVLDYDGNPVTIPLDPRLGPKANAQRYFDLYRKARRTAARSDLHEKARHEEAWLEALAYDLEQTLQASDGSEPDRVLAEVEAVAAEADHLLGSPRSFARAGKVEPAQSGRPARYLTSDGLTVLAGRSARQNEVVSLKLANPDDLWFHARNCPGSHVVLRGQPGGGPPPDRSLLEAAALAAHLSAARGNGKVEVDYTEARHLRRPKGAARGLVLYDPHQTILVDTSRTALPREASPQEPIE